MAHEHEVAGLVPVVVDGVEIDVAEHGLGAESVGGVLGVDELAKLVHNVHGGLLLGVTSSLRNEIGLGQKSVMKYKFREEANKFKFSVSSTFSKPTGLATGEF